MFRCLGRLVLLLALLTLVPWAYCALTPADEYWRARALAKVSQYDQAAHWYETGLARYPDSGMNRDARFELGECYFKAGKSEQAATMLRKAVEGDPSNSRAPEAQMTVGRCLMSLGKDDAARREFAKIREQFPAQKDLCSEAEYLIAGMCLEKGDLAAAAKHARWVVSECPTSKWAPRCQLMVGDILSQKEAWDRASEAYEKVVADYPDSKEAADAQFRIAKIHYNQKEYKESLSALRDALSVAKAARLLNSKMVTDIRNLLSLATEMVAKSKDDGAPPE